MKNRDEVGDSKPPSWPAEPGTDPRILMSYWPVEKTRGVLEEARARSAQLAEPIWEGWYDRALEAGIDIELAGLGRDLMREACDQGWEDERAADSGWLDDGDAMLELAGADPDTAATRWRELLGR